METNPLVSICIPAYNAQNFIAETLESALAQDYPRLEIIVSDDCSQDETLEIVERYESRGVRAIKQTQNLGMFGNFNSVIRASSGKYVLKLDADDLVDPNHVSSQVRVMEEHPDVTFAHGACRLIDVDGKLIGYERSTHGSFIRDGKEEWVRYLFGPRAVNIVTIRRESFDKVGGYDERYRYSGDWAMHRALLRIGSVFYNDEVIASYRAHSIGKTGIRLVQAKEWLWHIQEIEEQWLEGVGNKTVWLQRVRRFLGLRAVKVAARCDPEERQAIINLLPEYTNDVQVRLIGKFVELGGSPLIRAHEDVYRRLRQLVKRVFYY